MKMRNILISGIFAAAVLFFSALPLSHVYAGDISTTGTDTTTTDTTTENADAAASTETTETYAVNGKGYKLSHETGKYNGEQTIKIQAKKGYNVYYSFSSKNIPVKNRIKAKKTKSVKIGKTTTLRLIAVKEKTKVTQPWLNLAAKSYKKYTYTIVNQITFGDSNIKAANENGLTISNGSSMATVDINKAGTYVLTGSGTNTRVTVNKDEKSMGTVNLILSGLTINNSTVNDDNPVISIGGNTKAVEIKMEGANTITGSGGYSTDPAKGIIYDGSSGYIRFTRFGNDDTGSLTINDGMTAETDYGTHIPSAGVCAVGKIAVNNGTLTFATNGECLYGKNIGVAVTGGELNLVSNQKQGIRSDNGNINISGGTVNITGTGQDGFLTPSGTSKISGGTVTMTGIKGDGIEGRNVDISGGTISITTAYDYGATDFYDQGLGANRYNTRSTTTKNKIDTITEYVNYNTGSHAGILAGREGFTYSVKAGDSGVQISAGMLSISGGKITIDTTAAGSMSNNLTGTGYAAAEKDLYIIGSPSPALKSYNTIFLTGGVYALSSGGSAIMSDEGMNIINDTDITISQAYRGLEAPEINIGTENMVNDTTQVKMYTSGTGIYGYSTSKTYEFEDSTFNKYRRVSVSNKNNNVNIYSGYVNVMIDSSKTITGKGAGTMASTSSAATTGTGNATGSGGAISFKPDGNGIYSSGNINILGGNTVIYGPDNTKKSIFSFTGKFKIGKGATVLGVGDKGTGSNTLPTTSNQPFIEGVIPPATTNNTNTGTNTNGTQNYTPNLKSGDNLGVLNSSDDTLVAIKLPKDANYIFFTSPDTKTSSYNIFTGGDLTSSLNSYAYDGRYQTYTNKKTNTNSGGTGTGGNTSNGPTPRVTLSGKKK